ncbi:MAG TPA: PilZ domain-containing protein, partial [Polyangia bacterium]|nr:PilZ domain-containing protein [Polyangia bacterium]
MPIALKIRFKSATLGDFVEQYSRDVSKGGIFIRMRNPMPIGTLIKFDFRLQSERSLIQGVGRVVWRRD